MSDRELRRVRRGSELVVRREEVTLVPRSVAFSNPQSAPPPVRAFASSVGPVSKHSPPQPSSVNHLSKADRAQQVSETAEGKRDGQARRKPARRDAPSPPPSATRPRCHVTPPSLKLNFDSGAASRPTGASCVIKGLLLTCAARDGHLIHAEAGASAAADAALGGRMQCEVHAVSS